MKALVFFGFALLFAFASIGATAEPSAEVKTPAELVQMLGDPSFKVRESASRELVRLREKSLEAIEAGLKSPDAEVVDRCTRLLPLAQDAATRFYLVLFAKDANSVKPDDLPGLTRWVEVLGKSEASLAAYREVAKVYSRDLNRLRREPARTAELYARMAIDLRSRPAPMASEAGSGALPELHMFLFLGSQRERPERLVSTGLPPSYFVFNQWPNLSELLEPADSPARRLLVACLDKEDNASVVRRVLTIAAASGVREVIPLAVRRASEVGISATLRGSMVASLGQFHSPKDVPLILPLLADETVIRPAIKVGGVSTVEDVQMRDIALGLAVVWSGQNPQEYHFDKLTKGIVARSYIQYAIEVGKRDESLKRWRKWLAERPTAE